MHGLSPRNFDSETVHGNAARLTIVVVDPHAVFARAVAAGAHEIRPVHEQYGRLLGPLVDPATQRREIGTPLGPGVGKE